MEPGHGDDVVRTMWEAVGAGTWAQGGAGCFLDILPLTEGAPVERRRVGAAPAPFLPAAPTAGTADGPLGPRRPPTVHWPDREGLGSGSGGFLKHAGPGDGSEHRGCELEMVDCACTGREALKGGPSLCLLSQGLTESPAGPTLFLAGARAANRTVLTRLRPLRAAPTSYSACSWCAQDHLALLPILGTQEHRG